MHFYSYLPRSLPPNHHLLDRPQGYIRVAKCNIALGDANAALSVLRQAAELEAGSRAVRDETANAQALLRCTDETAIAKAKGDYRTVSNRLRPLA